MEYFPDIGCQYPNMVFELDGEFYKETYPDMECQHPNMVFERDGEFYKETCPDCGYEREFEDN